MARVYYTFFGSMLQWCLAIFVKFRSAIQIAYMYVCVVNSSIYWGLEGRVIHYCLTPETSGGYDLWPLTSNKWGHVSWVMWLGVVGGGEWLRIILPGMVRKMADSSPFCPLPNDVNPCPFQDLKIFLDFDGSLTETLTDQRQGHNFHLRMPQCPCV